MLCKYGGLNEKLKVFDEKYKSRNSLWHTIFSSSTLRPFFFPMARQPQVEQGLLII